MTLKIIDRRSPNYDARPEGTAIDMLIMHYTGMKTAEEALARLTDYNAMVSAHYTIDRDGTVYAHVPEEMRAWHAGVSYWRGQRAVNACSIGIELVNPGHEFGYVPFPDAQIEALIDLSHGILARHPIPKERVLGHSDVAPARKTDPGELFPWQALADHGIGIWPKHLHQALRVPHQEGLAQFGYGVEPADDVPAKSVVTAFQRHFRPAKVDGEWDHECGRALQGLLAHFRVA